MANKKITDLTLHTSLELSDVIAIVNSSETKKTTYGSLYYGIRDGLVSGSSQIDLSNYALISGGNEFIGDQTINGSVDITGNTLHTGTTSTVGTTNLSGTNTISGSNTIVGGTSIGSINSGETLIYGYTEYNAGNTSFRAPNLVNFESTPIFEVGLEATGSVDITGSFTSSLTEGHFFVGNGDNITEEFPTSSFVQTTQTGSLVQSAHISLYSSASQQLQTSGSVQPITFTSVWTQNGVNLVSGSQLVMENAGTYKFSFTAHVTNSDNELHDAFFWIKYNGNNFPNSTTTITLPARKSSGLASSQTMTMNIVGVAQNDNDYIELYWTGQSTLTGLTEVSEDSVKPESPSVIANIVRVG